MNEPITIDLPEHLSELLAQHGLSAYLTVIRDDGKKVNQAAVERLLAEYDAPRGDPAREESAPRHHGRSAAVEQGLKDVQAALTAAKAAKRIDRTEMWDLRANIDDGVQFHSLGGGQLRAYARDLAHLEKVAAHKIVAGDRVFQPTRDASWREWREVAVVERDGELVRLVYKGKPGTRPFRESFERSIRIMRVPAAMVGEQSALHDLVRGAG